MQCCPRGSRQQQRTGENPVVVLILMGDNIAQVKTLHNVVQDTPDNITQEKTQSMSSEHHFSPIFILDRLIFR